ncbi:peptidase M15A [Vibrio phage vB_VpP_FE11]|uniref:Peptidase M15A n=1 Tax=Vibrio phage vB_VpP_FE11 TaxID=2723990 RepID=A0A6H0X3W8_9CAUD|nr:peptidase M15A [Vibrio phage vB_VpP_FE11]
MLIKDTLNFKISKFACQHCGALKLDLALLMLAQMVREHFGEPLKVESGYRCPTHNEAVGGAADSRHLHGDAVDLHLLNKDRGNFQKLQKLYDVALALNPNGGIGLYDWGVHIDTRGEKARWDYRSDKYKQAMGKLNV